MKREEKGITLLALIITIIVLLILASVSITMVVGDNGLFNRAKQAKEATEESKAKEELQLAVTEVQTGALIKGSKMSVTDLKNVLGDKGYEVPESVTSFPVRVTKDGKEYVVSENGGVSRDTLASLGISNNNIGDYIDLGNNVVKTEATTDDWRILYVDGTNVYAILADYLPNAKIPTEDGIKKAAYNVWGSKGRTAFLDNYILNTAKWSSLANGISGATVTGTPTKDLIEDSFKAKNNASSWDTGVAATQDLYKLQMVTENSPGTFGYWLASPYDDNDWDLWNMTGAKMEFLQYAASGYAVRPVVCLTSEIPANKAGDVWKVEK